jgi:peptidoglycan/xylan/chitin deacetylase (PgdA/CDA1 family)
MKALIICYHCVKDETNSYLRPTKVADFENQMRYLSTRYNPISLETMAQHLQDGTSLPPKAIAVTFDDGYHDNYENAYPVLRKYHVPATGLLATNFIGTGKIPAWEEAYYTGENALMLSWKQVRAMSDGGISFGSHTLSHPLLTRIPRRQREYELCRSKEIIEQQIGKPVTTFAYPSGDFDSETKEVVREAGYCAAVSIRAGQNGPYDDVYALRRNLIQLRSVCHRLFPVSFLAEITGGVGRVRASYYKMRGIGVPGGL